VHRLACSFGVVLLELITGRPSTFPNPAHTDHGEHGRARGGVPRGVGERSPVPRSEWVSAPLCSLGVGECSPVLAPEWVSAPLCSLGVGGPPFVPRGRG